MTATRKLLTVPIWLAAVLSLWQPLLAKRCSCQRSHNAVQQTRSCDGHTPTPTHHCSAKCAHGHESAAKADEPRRRFETFSFFSPCHCPPDCSCHRNHQPQPQSPLSDAEIKSVDLVVTLDVDPAPERRCSTRMATDIADAHSPGALHICISLCRFTL